MTVGVVTDSGAGLTRASAAAFGIVLVPIWLRLDGREVLDGEEGLEDVLSATKVSTSGPSPGEFAAAIASALADHDRVIVLTVAASLSSTHQSARVGAERFGRAVRVLDTGTAAGAQALVALAAATAARTGGTLDDVEATARRAAARVRLVASLGTFDYLVRSGRVPGAAAWAAERLAMRPLFELRDGMARPARPVRGQNDIDRFVRRCLEDRGRSRRLHAIAMHAGAPERAHALADALRAGTVPETLLVEPFGTAMVAHTGPGLLGLAWRWEDA